MLYSLFCCIKSYEWGFCETHGMWVLFGSFVHVLQLLVTRFTPKKKSRVALAYL